MDVFFEKTAITQTVKTAWNHHNFSCYRYLWWNVDGRI